METEEAPKPPEALIYADAEKGTLAIQGEAFHYDPQKHTVTFTIPNAGEANDRIKETRSDILTVHFGEENTAPCPRLENLEGLNYNISAWHETITFTIPGITNDFANAAQGCITASIPALKNAFAHEQARQQAEALNNIFSP